MAGIPVALYLTIVLCTPLKEILNTGVVAKPRNNKKFEEKVNAFSPDLKILQKVVKVVLLSSPNESTYLNQTFLK